MENNGGQVAVRKGAWTQEEDDLLKKCIERYGEGKWHQVPLRAGLNRCRKSCRLRWLNYLRPNIKKGYFTRDEVDLIIRLHKLLGNRWSLIAGRLPGRTANNIKNFWNTHIQKNIRSIRAGLGGETENCTRTKTITKSNIIRPRPRTFSKLQVPAGCSTIPDHQPSKKNNENPDDELQPSSSTMSLPRDQGTNDWTNNDPDECIRWWSNLLEISTHDQNGDETPFSFPSDLEHQIKESILLAGLRESHNMDQDGFSTTLSLDHLNVWESVSFHDQNN